MSACLEGLGDEGLGVECGQHQHRRTVLAKTHAPHGLDAVHTGHADVEEHHIRTQGLDRLHRAEPVCGFSHHRDALGAVEDQTQARPHQRLVVDQQELHHGAHARRRKRSAVAVASSHPWAVSSLSRSPTSP